MTKPDIGMSMCKQSTRLISEQCSDIAQGFMKEGNYVMGMLWANVAQVARNAEQYDAEPKA